MPFEWSADPQSYYNKEGITKIICEGLEGLIDMRYAFKQQLDTTNVAAVVKNNSVKLLAACVWIPLVCSLFARRHRDNATNQ